MRQARRVHRHPVNIRHVRQTQDPRVQPRAARIRAGGATRTGYRRRCSASYAGGSRYQVVSRERRRFSRDSTPPKAGPRSTASRPHVSARHGVGGEARAAAGPALQRWDSWKRAGETPALPGSPPSARQCTEHFPGARASRPHLAARHGVGGEARVARPPRQRCARQQRAGGERPRRSSPALGGVTRPGAADALAVMHAAQRRKRCRRFWRDSTPPKAGLRCAASQGRTSRPPQTLEDRARLHANAAPDGNVRASYPHVSTNPAVAEHRRYPISGGGRQYATTIRCDARDWRANPVSSGLCGR